MILQKCFLSGFFACAILIQQIRQQPGALKYPGKMQLRESFTLNKILIVDDEKPICDLIDLNIDGRGVFL